MWLPGAASDGLSEAPSTGEGRAMSVRLGRLPSVGDMGRKGQQAVCQLSALRTCCRQMIATEYESEKR